MSNSNQSEETIFNEALAKQSDAERAAFLDVACGNNAQLRARLEVMLEGALKAGGFLETVRVTSPGDKSGAPASITPTERPGDRIGRYKLLQAIGEGGCGTVYMAEQEEPVRRRVALKVIKLGMDTKSVIARFEAERQALAMMDHPNIAKVLDAGTTETGRPYFVMELVRGVRITEFCDEAKLPMRERLDLFVKVCHAIQHAHQKGIIHRDIKPSNILVTVNDGVPVPKVIDFGIAKATQGRLTDSTLFTAFEQFIGTPAYMSPEQAVMTSLDIDTRSDIYSLGVLLYELLTGKTPFDAKKLLAVGLDEIRRTIREVEPPRPSTRLSTMLEGDLTTTAKARAAEAPKLINLLRGDLDWIVMKALEKDRTRRYETANSFATDVQRHLGNEPVVARPPSAAYKFQKLVRRNKLAFAAAAAVSGVLVLGILASTWQAVRALREERRATVEATRARAAEVIAQSQSTRAEQEKNRAESERQRAEAQELVSRRQAYANDMNLAFRAWESGGLALLRDLLNRQRPVVNVSTPDSKSTTDLRGWEWRYLWAQARGDDIATLTKHDAELIRLAISPDGKLAASADIRGTVKLWDMEARREVFATNLHSGVVCALEFSPDGQLLGSDCYDGTVRVLDVSTRQLIYNPPAVPNLFYWHLAFSTDSKIVAIVAEGPGGGAQFLDLATRQPIRRIDESKDFDPIRVHFLPDRKNVLFGMRDGRVRIEDYRSGELVREFPGHPWNRSRSRDHAFERSAVSRDGRLLAMASYDGTVSLWELATSRLLTTFTNHTDGVCSATFSPDGRLLATASWDQTVRLFDVTSFHEKAVLRGHAGEVWDVRFTPDGRRLLSGGEDGVLRLWHPAPKVRADDVIAFPTSTQGGRLYVRDKVVATWNTNNAWTVWNLETRQPIESFPADTNFWRYVYSPRARTFYGLIPKKSFSLRNVETGRQSDLSLYQGHYFEYPGLEPAATTGNSSKDLEGAFSPDGALFAQCSDIEDTLRLSIWDVADGKELHRIHGSGDSRRVTVFSQSNRYLAIGEVNGNLRVVELGSHQNRIFEGHKEFPYALAFAPDEKRLASGGYDSSVKLWDVATGKQLAAFPVEGGRFSCIAFSPDGSRVIAGMAGSHGKGEGVVRVWDLESMREVVVRTAHAHSVLGVAFLDDDTLVSLSRDSLRIWRAPKLAEIEREEAARANYSKSEEAK